MDSSYLRKNLPLIIILILLGIIFIIGTCVFFFFILSATNLQAASSPSIERKFTSTQSPSIKFTFTISPTSTPIQVTETYSLQSPTHSPTIFPAAVPTSTAAAFGQDTWCVPWNTESSTAHVIQVLDGTTIEVQINGAQYTVRYLGIEVPGEELHPDVWSLSKQENEKLVADKKVLLLKDRSDIDNEGRLLRYVISGVTFVNLSMIESGYAIANSQPPDISCDPIFAQAEIQAIQTKHGIWAPTITPSRVIPTPTKLPALTGNVIISIISYEGESWQQPDEFVEINNQDEQPIQLQDWILRDSQDHIFRFPAYIMIPGQFCRIYTNLYNPSTCGFSFDKPSGLWSDDGECAYLFDSDGNPIDTFCYE